MKIPWIMCFLLLYSGWASGQELSNIREKVLYPLTDTLAIDSLSVIPGTLSLQTTQHKPLPDSLYHTDFLNARIRLSEDLIRSNDSLIVTYRVFPVRLNDTWRYLEPGKNRIDPLSFNSLIHSLNPTSSRSRTGEGANWYTSGDLSRGVQIGNNQDASLQSNLNLQISGQINQQFAIEAQLSDANIPLQPEGNTSQLQEFDRLFIRLFSHNTQILAGDFTLHDPPGYFQRMNKNLQGLQVTTKHASEKHSNQTFQTRTTAAVVKGRFNRMHIQGNEGNQGPYRLTGSEGERYIQVIAGSEKVFIDGIPLNRGENEDYTINYNTAELSFTPKRLITKDKRIIIQFEYTDRNYARFVLSSENQWITDKGEIYLNLFNESDAKNQPLLQDLSADQKDFLATLGDQTHLARVNNYYETPFSNDRVLYRKTDTLVNGVPYPDILVYSTHPDSTNYQAGFSYLGENKGNYVPVQSAANGQVYQWVAPQNGIPQGSYEPITRLITPKSKQIYSIGGKARLTEKMTFTGELSLSANDQNTFSQLDSQDNQGTGLMAEISRQDHLKADQSLSLSSWVRFRRTGQQYDALEPFRPVEFDRDWNLPDQRPDAAEYYLQTGLTLTGKDSIRAAYTFDLLNFSDQYQATKHQSTGGLNFGKNLLSWSGSLMQSADVFRQSTFLRHSVGLSRTMGPVIVSVSENHEGNTFTPIHQTSFQPGSFQFQEWNANIKQPDEQKIPWFVGVKWRTDYLPDSTRWIKDFESIESSAGLSFKGTSRQSTRLSAHIRKLRPVHPDGTNNLPENTTTIRAEEQFSLGNGILRSGSFYEIGSGLERKQEFYYLEVPSGQGFYTWSDYNGNNLKELDEFEPAVFADMANYIRVFRPGTDYLPVYSNRLTQTFQLNPGIGIKDEKSPWRWLRLFSNAFSYTANRKNYQTNFLSSLNPFFIADSLIVTMHAQMRNSLSVNSPNRKLGLDYIYQNSFQQNLMTYGIDARRQATHAWVSRAHVFEPLWINNRTEIGTSGFSSEFFTHRNYDLKFWRNTANLTLEATNQIRINLEWTMGNEHNQSGTETSQQQQLELGADFHTPKQGVIHLDVQYIHFNFSGEENSPVGYVMLKGFRPGSNGTANLSLRRKINEVIQVDLTYGLRMSQNTQVIHTGNVAVRAVF